MIISFLIICKYTVGLRARTSVVSKHDFIVETTFAEYLSSILSINESKRPGENDSCPKYFYLTFALYSNLGIKHEYDVAQLHFNSMVVNRDFYAKTSLQNLTFVKQKEAAL
jgi:hypothetical protein